MVFKGLRRWTARRFNSVPQPSLIDFNRMQIDQVATFEKRAWFEVPSTNDIFDDLSIPDIAVVDNEFLDETNSSLETHPFPDFRPLSPPTMNGLVFSDHEFTPQPTPTSNRSNGNWHRSGLGRRISNPKRSSRGSWNMFARLRLILQPPVFSHDDQPINFEQRPYPFQIAGIKWLIDHDRGLLADQMGLGKTMQAIIAMRVLYQRGKLKNALVVCPASMSNTWEREFRMWAPELRTQRLQGNPETRLALWEAPCEVSIVSYETLARDADDISPRKFDLYVLDEAQKIKNPRTKNHHAVKRFQPEFRWALTGTPIENSVDDVVALFSVLKPDLFSSRFMTSASKWYGAEFIRREIEPHMLRRTIAETSLELPKLTHQDHWLDLKPGQRRAYGSLESESIATLRQLGTEATRIHVLALITKLKQICNYDVISGQSCKLDFLQEELRALVADNDKALVFSQYPNKTLKEIGPKLEKFNPITFDGSMSTSKRDEAIAKFQGSDSNDVMLMSVKAGGVGITLTRANHVFHFDHWWNPATVDQASARAHRIGQNKPVFVHSLYVADTIEERIYNLLKEKRELFDQVIGKSSRSDDAVLQRLSDKDLYGLFGLDAPDTDKDKAKAESRESRRTEFVKEPTNLKATSPHSRQRPQQTENVDDDAEVDAAEETPSDGESEKPKKESKKESKTEKRCGRCHVTKKVSMVEGEVNEFYRNRHSTDGYSGWCRKCNIAHLKIKSAERRAKREKAESEAKVVVPRIRSQTRSRSLDADTQEFIRNRRREKGIEEPADPGATSPRSRPRPKQTLDSQEFIRSWRRERGIEEPANPKATSPRNRPRPKQTMDSREYIRNWRRKQGIDD